MQCVYGNIRNNIVGNSEALGTCHLNCSAVGEAVFGFTGYILNGIAAYGNNGIIAGLNIDAAPTV